MSALFLIVDEIRHPQPMWIMNVVWPVTALYMGPVAIWAYATMGRGHQRAKPMWQSVFIDATHCGAGCTLGDIVAENAVYHGNLQLPGNPFWSGLALDYIAAYILGIAFQYFNIAPMRGDYGPKSLIDAIKADTLSLTAFEIGLFGWMALVHYVLLPTANPGQGVYWFMMQLGMCLGFITTYPMNWWLIRTGIKDPM